MLYDKKVEIRFINRLSHNTYHFGIKCSEISESCFPGQFVMVKVSENFEPLLRRPFSILKTNPEEGIIEIVFKIVGEGTKILSKRRTGDFLDVLGPLGVKFNISEKSKNYVLIGGGIGFPPLFFIADSPNVERKDITFYFGAHSRDGIFFKQELAKMCNKLIISTEDYTLGEKGLITDLFIKDINAGIIGDDVFVFACGPAPMLKKVSSICKKNNIQSQISLESVMACGTGLCQGCAVRIKNTGKYEYKLVCKDGPVFNSDDILWED